MSCELAQTTAHGYCDGELDAVRAAEFERHLQSCMECQDSLKRVESLRTRLQEGNLYEGVPPQFREKIRKQLSFDSGIAPVRLSFRRRGYLIPAFAIAAVIAISAALFLVQQRAHTERVASELIDAHVRSLQPGHLTDVQSTDQHTVKPWFDGKLDFIPPVSDYSAQGFPLIGGRLDVLDGHSVAALVYARRKHFINLFVWPARESQAIPDKSGARQGYNWVMWRSGEMQLCLISDASGADLQELRGLIR